MPSTHYPQFCALARAAELLGERWTLLIVRELLLGPRRFTDLRARLDGISTSVLTERLDKLHRIGIVETAVLPPPAASTVYQLTADGRDLKPVVFALIRWGARYLLPTRPDEHVEADWLRLALAACARQTASPPLSVSFHMPLDTGDTVLHLTGGPHGTQVTAASGPADITVWANPATVLGLIGGALKAPTALSSGQIRITGSLAALERLPELFTVVLDHLDPAAHGDTVERERHSAAPHRSE